MFLVNNWIMIMVNIHEAKAKLSQLLIQVARGERVILCRRNVPVAEIRPIEDRVGEPRPLGLARRRYGDHQIPDSFFEPLPEDLLEGFDGDKT